MVGPFNSILLRLFGFHINVEISYAVQLITYLYKYFYKELDYADGRLEND